MKNKCSSYEVRTRKTQNCWPFLDILKNMEYVLEPKSAMNVIVEEMNTFVISTQRKDK